MLLVLAIAGLFVLPDPWRVVVLGAAAIVEVGEVYFWIRFLRRYRVTTGAEGLIGERVEVIERCDPRGLARVRGEIWNARIAAAADRERGATAVALEAGEEARISAVEGLTLVLEPAAGRPGSKRPVRDAPAPDAWSPDAAAGDPASTTAEHGKGPR